MRMISASAFAVLVLLNGTFAQAQTAAPHAVTVVHSLAQDEVKGVFYLTEAPGGVKMHGEVSGLKPGDHGFHIHQFGDCSKVDGSSAGEHFNPASAKHGGPKGPMRHHGDLGNIVAGSDGKATVDDTFPFSLSGANSVIGRSIVIHEQGDDLKTDPAGNSGKRIACGVIGIAKSD